MTLSPSMAFLVAIPLPALPDLYRPHPAFVPRLHDINVQEASFEGSGFYFQAVRKDKAALELTRRDAAVQIHLAGFILLLAADDELPVLDLDRQVLIPEARDGERNTQALGADLLHVVWGIAVGLPLGGALQRRLEPLKANEEGTVEYRPVQSASPRLSELRGGPSRAPKFFRPNMAPEGMG
jgi:hypothetical protein